MQRAEYDRLVGVVNEKGQEILALQEKYQGKETPGNVGDQIDALVKEAEEAQSAADLIDRAYKFSKYGSEPEAPTIPGRHPAKREEVGGYDDEVVGYISVSEAVRRDPQFEAWVKGGHQGQSGAIQLDTFIGGHMALGQKAVAHGFVPVTRKTRARMESHAVERKAAGDREGKAVPTIGTGVIDPDRVAGLWRVTEDAAPSIRDLLTVATTDSDNVEWIREDSFTRAAAETAHGSEKPEATVEYSLQSSPVRTIAVHIPVHNQSLDDWGILRSLLDNRLLYDLSKREEEQILYGDGTGVNLSGLLLDSNAVPDIAGNGRYVGGTTSDLDAIRMGVTDIKKAGYQANGVAIEPEDWEGVVLSKGSDLHYLGQIFPDADRGMRIWGLRVVELFGLANSDTGESQLVVGDWRRGAVLYDRMRAQIFIGVINAQFIENARTILAEERVAFALHAPAAFARLQTVAATSS